MHSVAGGHMDSRPKLWIRWLAYEASEARTGLLLDDENLGSRCSPYRSRPGTAPACEWTPGKDHDVNRMLRDPGGERRVGTTEENLERRSG